MLNWNGEYICSMDVSSDLFIWIQLKEILENAQKFLFVVIAMYWQERGMGESTRVILLRIGGVAETANRAFLVISLVMTIYLTQFQ